MALFFPFKREKTSLFRWIYRPYAIVSFWSHLQHNWLDIAMIVDTGADYTLLPKQYMGELGVNERRDTHRHETRGVGGASSVFLLNSKQKIKIGDWERSIPLGFLPAVDVPPLLGRLDCVETFRVVFEHHVTAFDNPS